MKHNPHIDWSSCRIASWSLFSLPLTSALPSASTESAPVENTTPDLSSVSQEYYDLQEFFSKQKALSLPPNWPYEFAIDLLSEAPLPTSQLYNLSKHDWEAMGKYIKESFAVGFIHPSSSLLGEGCFFFFWKEGQEPSSMYWLPGPNKIRIKNKCPLPLINCFWATARRYNIHQTRPLQRLCFWSASEKVMNGGHFEYLLMPFGLITAPAVFQALVNYFSNIFVFVNLDDALIFSKLLAEHQVHVHSVLQYLLENGLYVKAEKCEFHSSICLFPRIYFDRRAGEDGPS